MNHLDQCVEARRDLIIRDLQALLAIPSVKEAAAPGAPFGQPIRRALDWFLERGRDLGFAVQDVQGYAGHVEYGRGSEIIGVLAHLDVVPPGEGWSHPPYAGRIAEGRLFGRGSIDDKGPAVACLHAMAALRDAGLEPRRRLRLILGCDEEDGWECVDRYFQAEPRPLFGFSPDAEFPLIIAEKGFLGLRAKRAWSTTPSSVLHIARLQGGTRPNVVPERCDALFGAESAGDFPRRLAALGLETAASANGITATARGVSAHASTPEKGSNAIGRFLQVLAQLDNVLPPEQAGVIRFLSETFDLHHDGRGFGLSMSDEVSGALTLNLGTINWTPGDLTLEIDIRYPVTADGNEITARARRILTAAGFSVEIFKDLPPLHVPVEHPMVQSLLRVYAEKTGSKAEAIAMGGRTYSCAIGTGVAFGPVFPGRPELAHQCDEHVSIDDLLLATKIYAAAMHELTRE